MNRVPLLSLALLVGSCKAAVPADEVTKLPGWDGPLPTKHYSGCAPPFETSGLFFSAPLEVCRCQGRFGAKPLQLLLTVRRREGYFNGGLRSPQKLPARLELVHQRCAQSRLRVSPSLCHLKSSSRSLPERPLGLIAAGTDAGYLIRAGVACTQVPRCCWWQEAHALLLAAVRGGPEDRSDHPV